MWTSAVPFTFLLALDSGHYSGLLRWLWLLLQAYGDTVLLESFLTKPCGLLWIELSFPSFSQRFHRKASQSELFNEYPHYTPRTQVPHQTPGTIREMGCRGKEQSLTWLPQARWSSLSENLSLAHQTRGPQTASSVHTDHLRTSKYRQWCEQRKMAERKWQDMNFTLLHKGKDVIKSSQVTAGGLRAGGDTAGFLALLQLPQKDRTTKSNVEIPRHLQHSILFSSPCLLADPHLSI